MQGFALSMLLVPASAALAFGAKPEHSTVEATASGGNIVALSFKVAPASGMTINLEGPWKLEIKSHEGLAIAKTTLTRAEMDEGLPGFKLKASEAPTRADGKVDYALTAFICTVDKSQCYREVHQGQVPWQKGS